MTQDDYDEVSTKALRLFEYGQVTSFYFVGCTCFFPFLFNHLGTIIRKVTFCWCIVQFLS